MSKTLLIKGANRSISLEMTRQAAVNGDQVIGFVRNIKKAFELVALTRENKAVTITTVDVTSESNMRQIVTEIKCKIDILLCKAGVLNGYVGLEDNAHHSQAIEAVLMTNIAGVFFTAGSFLPHLNEKNVKSEEQSRTSGKIAVILSIIGSQERADSGAPIYQASEAAATNIARCLAIELASRSIAFGPYHPGWV